MATRAAGALAGYPRPAAIGARKEGKHDEDRQNRTDAVVPSRKCAAVAMVTQSPAQLLERGEGDLDGRVILAA